MTKTKKKGGNGVSLGTLLALVVLCVLLAIASPNFLRFDNIMSILKQTTFNALVAVGMLLCLITAGIDLSVGANAIFCSCVMGMMVQKGMTNGWLMLVVAIVAGTLVGWINGMLLTRLHLPHPFVSTLGMKNVLWGSALLITGSQMVSSFPKEVTWLGSATFKGFPIGFILVVLLYIGMHIFLTKTALGRSIYCVGGNPEAARLSGIHSANVLTFCYTFSGLMAALAGIVTVGRSGICNGTMAIQPYDTDAIAACIIGGASFMGGKGTMAGTMVGALIIGVLRNGFTLLSFSSALQNVVLGLVIILAVFMDVTRERMEAKARRMAAANSAK
ncbi:MAG: ABC transporter permease [Butyricicoccus pullicaecorum]|nr:ABC transporter permease [Butyricicoccus pullicaecorum]